MRRIDRSSPGSSYQLVSLSSWFIACAESFTSDRLQFDLLKSSNKNKIKLELIDAQIGIISVQSGSVGGCSRPLSPPLDTPLVHDVHILCLFM